MKNFLGATFLLLILFSCNRHEKIYDEVMEIHDEAMAKMDRIMVLKSKLNDHIKMMAEDTLSNHTSELNQLNTLVQNLEEADEGMMNWMREFHNDYENVAKSEIMKYLRKQKEKITLVGQKMNEAIADAEKYLEASV